MVANRPTLARLSPKQILSHCRGKQPRRGSGKADQALINMVVDFDAIHLLDTRYNFTKRLLRLYIDQNASSKDIASVLAARDIRILHYVGGKPWLEDATAESEDARYAAIRDYWLAYQAQLGSPELDHLVAKLRHKHVLKDSNPKLKPGRKKNDPNVLYWPRSGRLRRSIADFMVGRRFSNLESHYMGLCRQLRQEGDLLKSILALVEAGPNR